MIDMVEDVLAFHRKFRCHVGDYPQLPPPAVIELRRRLNDEEHGELRRAMERGDLVDIADSVVDLIYVAVGTAIAYGIDIRPIWRSVQVANIAKTGGGVRPDGKVLKPAGWQPPPVAALVTAQIQNAATSGECVWALVDRPDADSLRKESR